MTLFILFALLAVSLPEGLSWAHDGLGIVLDLSRGRETVSSDVLSVRE
jgi:hypothetical protein